MATDEAANKFALSLASATSAQRRFALAVAVFQFVACAVVAPFTPPVPRIDGFIPTILGIVFLADLTTAILLFNQSALIASRALQRPTWRPLFCVFHDKRHGMGLGFAISRMIIDYHGGKLTESSDGKDGGASFQFVLPIGELP